MMTGNKGEWSEIYTLFKIISDKKLYAGDSDLNRIESIIFPIIRILRTESNGTYCFSYDDDIVVISGNDETYKIPVHTFYSNAIALLKVIKETKEAPFAAPEIEEFIKSFNCVTLRAKSSVKSDIRIIIHDLRTGVTPELGFSIKSQLGSASTLLNAGKTTNFIYEIQGAKLSDEEIDEINSINDGAKLKKRLNKIKELSGNLKFVGLENPTFANNLILIDSYLPQILAEMLLDFYTNSTNKCIDLINNLTAANPLNYDFSGEHPFYTYKFKRLLTDIALGMMPAVVWTGHLDATGGYLIVKDDGEVLCYHIYNRNDFEDYLLKNTKFDTPSSTRHGFGTIYKQNDKLYFKLNLQIRFIK